MRNWMLPLLLLIAVIAPASFGEDAPLTAKSSVDDVLKALQSRGQNLKDFTADVSQKMTDPITLHETTEKGKVFFQRLPDGDTRIRVNFDRKKTGTRPEVKWHREYLLAKGTLVDQDFDGKSENRHQVAKPGQKMDPLKLGEGPFPLPIGQEPAEVKKNFDVSIVPADKDDPANTIHAVLKPKPGTRFARKYDEIDVWVDLQSHFTPRIQATQLHAAEIDTTDLTNLQINKGLSDADFTLAPPGKGWSVSEDALQD
jgi:outer membrane lipoprotein-sorting protein